ncbi:hypothetical protein E4T48_00304 [Aureobasidium sp. EXF-10727]|nr:hypothetical protein E4T48_00304 [Aureobasidium sp. EXF-10727]
MGDTTAAIVWYASPHASIQRCADIRHRGIPVKPVDLLRNLDAFRKAIPTIHTLRLCNRFGKGERAGITKLPKELIGFIEDELLVWHRRQEKCFGQGWARKYCCFEGSCRPKEHLGDVGLLVQSEWYKSMLEDIFEAEVTDDYDYYSGDSNFGEEPEVIWEHRFESKWAWPSKVHTHMSSSGNSEVLRKYFRLDAFIMHENLDDSTTEYLKSTDRRFARSASDPEKATICYLVLPTQAAQWRVRLDPLCRDSGEYSGDSANSVLIDRSLLDLTEEHQRRFARAMLQLALKPSVHPSQLRGALSAASSSSISSSLPLRRVPVPPTDTDLSVEEKAKRDAMTTKRIKDLETSQWPKLMFLVNQHCYDA